MLIIVVRSIDRCCDRLYLSAKEGLVSSHEGVLGIYTWTGMHNGRPLFSKMVNNETIFFYFKQTGKTIGNL